MNKLVILPLIALAFAGCAAEDAAKNDEVTTGDPTEIIGGRTATVYAEAALITTSTFYCSGSVIAPRIVLTAGHCVSGAERWDVTLPFAQNQHASGTHVWTQYDNEGEFVNPDSVDVGIIILDTPLNLPSYPAISSAPIPDGTSVVNVGRIKDGQLSKTQLFYGPDVEVHGGAVDGFPYSYVSDTVIQSGDSGGPVYVTDGTRRTIVAVNSGAGGGTQTLARVDLVKTKIQSLIAQSGGGGGGTATPPTTTPPTQPTRPTPTCNGRREAEPNDDLQDADSLEVPRCGTLTRGDVDWFGWRVEAANITYDLELEASGDAEIRVFRNDGRSWSQLRTTSSTSLSAHSSGPGIYMVAVQSSSGAAQSYSIHLDR